jgi:hypothetical protein
LLSPFTVPETYPGAGDHPLCHEEPSGNAISLSIVRSRAAQSTALVFCNTPASFALCRQINQHDVRVFLRAIEHDLFAIWRNIEIAHEEACFQFREPAPSARIHIDQMGL